MKRYNGVVDFIRNNMNDLNGEFIVFATDMSENEEGCIAVTIAKHDGKEIADFLIYQDGREEQVELRYEVKS